jgi:hypothetical protein
MRPTSCAACDEACANAAACRAAAKPDGACVTTQRHLARIRVHEKSYCGKLLRAPFA